MLQMCGLYSCRIFVLQVIDAKLNFGGGDFSVHVDFALQI